MIAVYEIIEISKSLGLVCFLLNTQHLREKRAGSLGKRSAGEGACERVALSVTLMPTREHLPQKRC